MSLDAAIEHGKELRKPYYRAGRCDKTCRPHGCCHWCQSSRMHRHLIRMQAMDAQIYDAMIGEGGSYSL